MVHWMRHHQPGVPGISPEVITGALEHMRSQAVLTLTGPAMASVELRVPRRLVEGAPFDVPAYLQVLEGALTLALVKSRECAQTRQPRSGGESAFLRLRRRVRKLGRVIADGQPGAVDTISRSLLEIVNEAAFAQMGMRKMITVPPRPRPRDPDAAGGPAAA
ncbi:MAG: hypothetical protein H0V09_01390 [Gemmatimonadetes bacterium]|nr:hypothetical protein [Gemmatimonadota bacterium]